MKTYSYLVTTYFYLTQLLIVAVWMLTILAIERIILLLKILFSRKYHMSLSAVFLWSAMYHTMSESSSFLKIGCYFTCDFLITQKENFKNTLSFCQFFQSQTLKECLPGQQWVQEHHSAMSNIDTPTPIRYVVQESTSHYIRVTVKLKRKFPDYLFRKICSDLTIARKRFIIFSTVCNISFLYILQSIRILTQLQICMAKICQIVYRFNF